MHVRNVAPILMCSVCLCAVGAFGQQRTVSFRAGTVHLLQGRVNIDGKRIVLNRGITPPAQMHNGQRLHVDRGRVELSLGPGAALTMNDGATLRMQKNQLNDVQLVLERGSALVKVNRIYKGSRFRMMLPGGAVEMPEVGWYRFDAQPQRLRVYRGDADIQLGESIVKAKKGDAVDLAEAAAAISRFNLKAADPLIAWENQRNQEEQAREMQNYQAGALMRARRGIQSEQQKQAADDRQRALQQAGAPVPPSTSPAQ